MGKPCGNWGWDVNCSDPRRNTYESQRESEGLRYQTTRQSFIKEKERKRKGASALNVRA